MMARFDYRALGRMKQGQMNKTEAAYQQILELQRQAGEILWYKFEGIKFRLADKTFYSPDFVVLNALGQVEVHEVKGFMLEDANVKIKVAADMYPFVFKLVRLGRGRTWDIQEVA